MNNKNHEINNNNSSNNNNNCCYYYCYYYDDSYDYDDCYRHRYRGDAKREMLLAARRQVAVEPLLRAVAAVGVTVAPACAVCRLLGCKYCY